MQAQTGQVDKEPVSLLVRGLRKVESFIVRAPWSKKVVTNSEAASQTNIEPAGSG